VQRRTFIAALGSAAAVHPLVPLAQPPTRPVIGYVSNVVSASQVATDERFTAFREGLEQMGFTDGENITIEVRRTEGQMERLPRVMVDLVREQVAVIFTVGGDAATLIAKGATRTTPIVFLTASDPVRSGLVSSLHRPGLNATGVTMLAGPLGAKRLQLLRELLPQAIAIGLLVNPNNTNSEVESADVQAAGGSLGLSVHILEAGSTEQIERVFTSLRERKVSAVLVNADPLFLVLRDKLINLSTHHAVPTIYYVREYASNGGLMSYGSSIPDAMRQCGNYVGRILKGENPADLPVVQPTKFELVINLKTARALGLTVPPSLLARADEVIE
jgi:putative ABC transport system substrate-binding protein